MTERLAEVLYNDKSLVTVVSDAVTRRRMMEAGVSPVYVLPVLDAGTAIAIPVSSYLNLKAAAWRLLNGRVKVGTRKTAKQILEWCNA